MSDFREALEEVIRWCDLCFGHNTRAYYDRISERLKPFAEDKKVATIIRLADGGHSLVSSRFAYPHIASRSKDLLTGLK